MNQSISQSNYYYISSIFNTFPPFNYYQWDVEVIKAPEGFITTSKSLVTPDALMMDTGRVSSGNQSLVRSREWEEE